MTKSNFTSPPAGKRMKVQSIPPSNESANDREGFIKICCAYIKYLHQEITSKNRKLNHSSELCEKQQPWADEHKLLFSPTSTIIHGSTSIAEQGWDYRFLGKRKRGKEITTSVDVRSHLLPGFPNIAPTYRSSNSSNSNDTQDEFNRTANQELRKMWYIAARILGCADPTVAHVSGVPAGDAGEPKVVQRIVDWLAEQKFQQINGDTTNVARCQQVIDPATRFRAFGSNWMPVEIATGQNTAMTLDQVLFLFVMSYENQHYYGFFYPATGIMFPSKSGGYSHFSNEFHKKARSIVDLREDTALARFVEERLTTALVSSPSNSMGINKHLSLKKMWVISPWYRSARLNYLSKLGLLEQGFNS